MGECPSVQGLVNSIKSLTKSTGELQAAWSNSFPDPYHCCEQGGFIYVDYPIPDKLTKAYIVRAPKGDSMNQRTEGPNAAIDLNKPGIKQDEVILVSNFHTHPLSSQVGGDPYPSRADMSNAYHRGIPGIVLSRDGIYAYGPKHRENTTNPKGYPDPIPQPGDLRPNWNKPPQPPWVVKNQWPEGTPTEEGNKSAAASVAKMEDVEFVETQVMVVEWSDEGVEYYGNFEDQV